MRFLAAFFRDGQVEGFMNGGGGRGFGGREWVGVGKLAGVEDDEVEVGFSGGAAALSWRKIWAVRG